MAEPKTTANETWSLLSEGDVIAGKYRILGVVGQGGLAVVYAALHDALEQRVAIKMLLPQWAKDPEVVARFAREGRSAIRIRSEHVVRVLDVDTTDAGAPYIVLEYLDGQDLEALLEQTGPLPIPLAVDYVLQACEAIAEAHAAGIVHRDLKPSNLFLTHRADGSDCVKVLDFGISKDLAPRPSEMDLTSPEIVMGSPQYMSPEQLTSTASADERADIWSLGTILYELLAGAPAFDGDAGPQVCVNVMQLAPAPLSSRRGDLPDSLEATILLCLEKEPARRFGNVGELAMALAAFGTPETAHASADRTVRVLKAAGIIPTSLRGGLFNVEPMQEAVAQAPASRRASIPPRAPREAAEVAGAIDVPMPVPEFHFHRRRSGLVAAIALLACAGLGAAICFYWWQDAGPTRMAETHVVTSVERSPSPWASSVAAVLGAPQAPPTSAAPSATVAAAPPPAPPTAPADTVAVAAQQGDPTRPPLPATKRTPRAWRHAVTSQRPAAPPPSVRGPDPSIATGYTGAPPALPPDVSPYDAPTPAPTPTATPTPIATATALPAPPASPDQLFDERK